ncbi:MAG TPA: L,D-transpeptidase family protein [Gaiellaceae bacterium]|nr:L,D-transpeptidase family protein [Gaiellaceae bacterium]
MAASAPPRGRSRRPPARRRSHRGLFVALAVVVLAAAVWAAAVLGFSGVTLGGDASALARVKLQPFAGSLASVRARGPGGRPVPLVVSHGRLTPRTPLAPGERIAVSVVVRRPGWSSWALGAERRETLTVETPVATAVDRWVTVPRGGHAQVRFDMPVERTSVAGALVAGSTVTLPTRSVAGSLRLATAARPWETLGAPVRVTWFPPADRPVVLSSPGPDARTSPLAPIRLTFSEPLSHVLDGKKPALVPSVPGRWLQVDSHTLVFRPSGSGAPFDSSLTVRFPTPVVVAGANRAAAGLHLAIAPASFVRLQQLLAQEGYLPVDWVPAGRDVRTTMRSEVAAAVAPPAGRFFWRYPSTPHELQVLWKAGRPNEITRGAVMMFQDEHGLVVDGIAGPKVWRAVLADAVAGKHRVSGYSYVFVHRNVPQLLTLWHNGHVVLTSPGNTGVPAAPTALGTWPVFEHIPVGRMSGTNPDGTHYNDPGIRWISYFHGGEALHAFNRASFGTPQSLGCVELPLDAAAKVWPYTPIGTLVTIEN